MPRREPMHDARGRLAAWYFDSLRSRVRRAARERRVSVARARKLERAMRELVRLPVPALQPVPGVRPRKRPS